MAKKVYEAVASDGTVFTRSTDRDYTHAVLAKDRKNGNTVAGDDQFGVSGFCGRYDLAVKKAAKVGQFYNVVEIVAATERGK